MGSSRGYDNGEPHTWLPKCVIYRRAKMNSGQNLIGL